MRLASGLALMVLALAATAVAAFYSISLIPNLAGTSLLLVWSVAGPFFCLGLYLSIGGWRLRFSQHLLFLGLIALTIAGGAFPLVQNGVNPVEFLPIWALPVLLSGAPIVIGLILVKAND